MSYRGADPTDVMGRRIAAYLLDSLIAKGGQAYVVCPMIEVQGPAAAKSVFSLRSASARFRGAAHEPPRQGSLT